MESAIRASYLPEYQRIRERFPSRRKDRVAYLRTVAETEGALSSLKGDIISLVATFESLWDLRDLLAHARMNIISAGGAPGGASLEFTDYFAAGENVSRRVERTTLGKLEEQATISAEASRDAHLLHRKIEALLPPLA